MTSDNVRRKFNLLNTPAFILLILSVAYMINSFTHFRLGNDVLRYIQLKEWLETGKQPVMDIGNNLPYGYPVFLLLLSKFSLCNSFFIVLANYLYLAGSLYFVSRIFQSSIKAWHLVALTLLNWSVVKCAVTPLSDIQYMFFSTGALYFFTAYMTDKNAGYIAGTLIFSFLAIITRTIGVLLIFSLALTLVLQKKNAFKTKTPAWKVLLPASALVLILVVLSSRFFRIQDYIHLMLSYYKIKPLEFWTTSIQWHLTDLAEVFINTSKFKINFISPVVKEMAFMAAGVFSLAYLIRLLIRKKKDIPVVIIIYLVGYIAVVFNWPTYDARFWVPVVPFFVALILHTSPPAKPYFRYVLFLWKFIYVCLGAFVIGYYSYLTLNKIAFAEKHDAGIWRKEYEAHFGIMPADHRDGEVRPYIMHVLSTYDR